MRSPGLPTDPSGIRIESTREISFDIRGKLWLCDYTNEVAFQPILTDRLWKQVSESYPLRNEGFLLDNDNKLWSYNYQDLASDLTAEKLTLIDQNVSHFYLTGGDPIIIVKYDGVSILGDNYQYQLQWPRSFPSLYKVAHLKISEINRSPSSNSLTLSIKAYV